MDLTRRLVRFGAARPHVLVVPVAGATGARLAVEAELARRGWPQALAPADADLLVTAGAPGPRLAEVVEALWRRIPAPRARTAVLDAAAAARTLDDARVQLVAPGRDDRGGAGPAAPDAGHTAPDAGPAASEQHGAHTGHMAMDMIGGLPMAAVGPDRDGLTLDRVHLPLGPVLPDWPAGLVVRVTLQGDVVQEAQADALDATTGPPFWDGRFAARELDALGRFLAVAGWDDAADRTRRLRDAVLTGADVTAPARALVARVRRSRVLRWSVRGVRAGDVDVLALLESRLAWIEQAVAAPDTEPAPQPGLAALAGALTGADLAAVRLVVAALNPDSTVPALDVTPAEVAGG